MYNEYWYTLQGNSLKHLSVTKHVCTSHRLCIPKTAVRGQRAENCKCAIKNTITSRKLRDHEAQNRQVFSYAQKLPIQFRTGFDISTVAYPHGENKKIAAHVQIAPNIKQ